MKSSILEDDTHVLHGPEPSVPLDEEMVGDSIQKSFLQRPKHSIAMIDAFTNDKLLHHELHQRAANLAVALRNLGFEGQRAIFSISSENCLEFFVVVLAALLNGAILAPLNHSYTVQELEHSLAISSPQVVFCSAQVLPKFLHLQKKLPHLKRIIVLGEVSPIGQAAGLKSLEDFVRNQLGGANVDVGTLRPAGGDPRTSIAFIMCSSGTTGMPKGVAISHMNFQLQVCHRREPFYAQPSELEGNARLFGLMPFFHGYGLMLTLAHLLLGNIIICLKKFDGDVFLRCIQDYRISVLPLAPPLAVFLAKSDKVEKYDLSSVEVVYCAAAPLKASTEEELRRKLNCQDTRQAYGLTEMTLAVTGMANGQLRVGSCGKVLTYLSAKVRDPDSGRSLGPNQVGELCFKGPSCMLGYYKNEPATRLTFTSDGWLKTGDLGYYDEDGYFYVIDRLKELIKYKGFQVAPAELEAILLNHAKVTDVGVIGLPDDMVGERPLAFVVRTAGCVVTEEELKDYVAGLVSPQKRLSGGVLFVDSIPKNPSGKILRRELRELLKNGKEALKSKL